MMMSRIYDECIWLNRQLIPTSRIHLPMINKQQDPLIAKTAVFFSL